MDTLAVDPWNRPFTVGLVGVTGGGPVVPPMPATRRAPQWPAACAAHLKRSPLCLACGRRAATVHHLLPVHLRPDLELDPANFASVCVPDHFVLGHLGDWQMINPHALADFAAHLKRVRAAKLI